MTGESRVKSDIGQIQTRHAEAYQQALMLLHSRHDAGEPQRSFTKIKEIMEPLIKELSEVSTAVKSVQERAWLNMAASQWQGIASDLKIPLQIAIGEPARELEPPPLRKDTFSEGQIISQLNLRAYEISRDRATQRERRTRELVQHPEFIDEIVKHPSQLLETIARWDLPGESKADWSLAEIGFATDILEGNVGFILKISPKSYKHLQNKWLEDVKRFKAYLFWEQNDADWSKDLGKTHYYKACRWFHERLGDAALKASPGDFGEVQGFIEAGLLADGKLDPRNKPDAHALVQCKAHRLWEDDPQHDKDTNWMEAESYVKEFYENIVPAVMEHERERAFRVLHAIEPTRKPTPKNRRWHKIIDCFEATLAVYFLEKSTTDEFLAPFATVAIV